MTRRVLFFILLMLTSLPWVALADSTTYWAELQVVDESTGDAVSDASVQFWRPEDSFTARRQPSWQMATPDPSPARPGVYHYTMNVDHGAAGRDVVYNLSVRKQGFQEFKASVTLSSGSDTLKKLSVRMKRELAHGQAVHVTVLKTDSDDGIYQAWVQICNESAYTDANGKITLQFNQAVAGGRCDVIIHRDSYDPISGFPIRISMLDDDARHQSITCRLKSINITRPGAMPSGCGTPTASANSPEEQQRRFLKVRATVMDKTDASLEADARPRVGGASLTLTIVSGSTVTGNEISSGVYEFTLDPDKDAGKNGTLVFRKHGFRDITTFVSGGQLVPGNQPVIVYMETDKRDAVKEIIGALTEDLAKKRNALSQSCSALQSANSNQAYNEQIALYYLSGGYKKFENLVKTAYSECATVASLRAQIRALATAAKNSEATLQNTLALANAAAATCRTMADADRLEALWNDIKKLSWDVHLNAGKAEGLNNKMKGIVSRAAVLMNRFDHTDADTPVPLNQFPVKAREILDSLRRVRANTGDFGRAYQQVRTSRQEAVKAHNEAITKIDAYLDPADRSDPRVAAFKTSVRSLIPRPAQPCNEEDLRERLDKYIADLDKGIDPFAKGVQDLKANYPLCGAERSEDALIREAQGSTAIITLVTGSDIPTKLQTRRANAGSTTTARPAPAAATSPDDDADGVPNVKDKCPGTPAGHPVDADGCSLLQRFAKSKMWIEGPESMKSGQPTWYKANGDSEFKNLLGALTGGVIYEWSVNGKPAGRGTDNFQYAPPAGVSGNITIKAQLIWVNARTSKEVPVKYAEKAFPVLVVSAGTPTKKKYGPFNVPWGSWLSTGATIKKGENFEVKATGAFKTTNQKGEIQECGPGGCGYWGWWTLKAKIGNQLQDVAGSGYGTALQDGTIELGCPRGGTFMKEDAGSFGGSLSVEVWVNEKSGPR